MGLREERTDGPPSGRAAFESLVREHRPKLLSHVRFVYPQADADAVVTDTFAIAWRRLDDAPYATIGAWLRGIARNVVMNTSRGQRRWRALGDRLALLDMQPAVEQPDSDARLQLAVVVEALGKLNRQDREVLLMLALEDQSIEEIATIFEISENAASARISRARKRLRSAVSGSGAWPAGADDVSERSEQ